MERGLNNYFYGEDQGGGVPNFPNLHSFPLNSPSWYTPTPQFAPPNGFVWNQTHLNSMNQNETMIPSNTLGGFSSSSGAIDSVYVDAQVPIMPPLAMDQSLGIDNMFLDVGQCLTLDELRNYPNIEFTNQVIDPSNPISNSGSNTSRNYTKRLWTTEEDSKLNALVSEFGTRNWTRISDLMGGRAGKQCRERWYNNLRPDIKLDVWTEEEERILIEAHEQRGNKWSQIAKLLPGRTENAIKNHWNAATRKKTMRLNRCKRYQPDNPKPKSTLLRDYIKGISSPSTNNTKMSTTSTTNNNVIIEKFTPNEYEPPISSFSSDSPSINPIIPINIDDEEFNFMKNLFSTTSKEPMVDQTNMNPQGFNGNAEFYGTSYSSNNIIEDNFDMFLINNSQTATQPLSDAYVSYPEGGPVTFTNYSEPIYDYGDMNMDFAFNSQGGGFFSE